MDIKRTLFPQDEEKSNVMPLIVPQTRGETMRSVARITNPEVGSSETTQLRLPYEEADDAEKLMKILSLTNEDAVLDAIVKMSPQKLQYFQNLATQFTSLQGLDLLNAAITEGFTTRETEENLLREALNAIFRGKEIPTQLKKRWGWGGAEHVEFINKIRRASLLQLLIKTITSGARPQQALEQMREENAARIGEMRKQHSLHLKEKRVQDI